MDATIQTKIILCPKCLKLLKAAASRGGLAGSREAKRKAGRLSAAIKQARAVRLHFDGHTLTVSEWALRLGISKVRIYRGLRAKLPLNEVLTVHGSEHLPNV